MGYAPPYALLNEHVVSNFDTAFRLNPPLRSEGDRLAVLQGLADGTIDAIASDHALLTAMKKHNPLGRKPRCVWH